eukprot:m.702365 g.702365  ORF g.702365 m.702365 type:complete len:52 (+) comp22915_c0_seq7:100-255(+)
MQQQYAEFFEPDANAVQVQSRANVEQCTARTQSGVNTTTRAAHRALAWRHV